MLADKETQNNEIVADNSPPSLVANVLRQPAGAISAAFLSLVVLAAIFAPWVWPDVMTERSGDLFSTLSGPSAEHLLGTDTLGRDVLLRLLVGTRVTMFGVLVTVVVAALIGVPFGLAAGYVGGRFDRAVCWFADLIFALPGVVLALLVLSIFPGNLVLVMSTIAVLVSPSLMRVVRASTIAVRGLPYVEAARVAGLSTPYIVTRHILTRIRGPIIVQLSLISATAVIIQSGLAFLGVLVPAPAPSWGGMIGQGISVIFQQPWLIWPPGVTITLTVLAFGLVSDTLRAAIAKNWSSASSHPMRVRHRPVKTSGEKPARVLPPAESALLSIRNLSVVAHNGKQQVTIVDDVSFDVQPGETVGLVGESGCGKTMTARAILGLLPGAVDVSAGGVLFDGRDLRSMTEEEFDRMRGREIGFISQDAMASLNPAYRVGWQLAENVRRHRGVSRREARPIVLDLLRSVHLPNPEQIARQYPHQLSGGMAQRVAIARALSGEPRLLIADEATTALDVTLQREILDLLHELQSSRGMGMLLITHDWGVAADICHRAVVMYAGQVVEQGPLRALVLEPLQPYTRALLAADPHRATPGAKLPSIPGIVPRPGTWSDGCRFLDRCALAQPQCTAREPVPLTTVARDREARCLLVSSTEESEPVPAWVQSRTDRTVS